MSQGVTVHLLNGVDGNTLTQGIYAHNKMLKFGIGGKYLGEGPISYNHTRLREIDLISIVNVDNDIEVACNIGKEFCKFNVYADYFEIIKWCNTHPHLIVNGHRSGTLKGIKFNQYFFGFTKDTISINKIQEVFKVNG